MNEISRQPLPYMTADEFLLWPVGETSRRVHLVDGEVRAMSPANSTHGLIQMNLGSLMRDAARALDRTLRVISEGAIRPAVTAHDNMRVPDIVVRRGAPGRREVTTPRPLAVAEILSPGNAADTWENVRGYGTLASVQEIVVVSSMAVRVDVYRRGINRRWLPEPETAEPGGRLTVRTVGLDCPIEDVYEGTWLLDSDIPPSSSQ